MIPVLANPRRRKKSRGRRGKRKVSARTRRRIKLAARRRSRTAAFKAGFAGGMRQCGRLVRRAAERRKASGGTTGFAIPRWGGNPRRRYRYRRNAWVPAYSFNPVASVTGGIKKAFSFGEIKGAVPYVVGGFANGFITNLLTSPAFVPDFLKSGWGNVGARLVSAGVGGLIAKKVAPGWSNGIVIGGAVNAINHAADMLGWGGGLKDWVNTGQPIVGAPVSRPALESGAFLGGMGCPDSYTMAGMGFCGPDSNDQPMGSGNETGEF